MTIILPNRQTKKVQQNNRSKILGDLWASFNLDLQSSLGLIKVSPRLQINTGGVSNQGLSVGFRAFNNLVFTIAGTRIFKNGALNLVSPFTEDASSGAITTYSASYSDLNTFNNVLVAAATDKLMSFSGSAWTLRATFGSADSLHKTCYFIKTNRLYYIDNYQTIKSLYTDWSEATSGSNFISLDYKSGLPYTMESDSTDIWIGTVKTAPSTVTDGMDGASIMRWDGISSQITIEYKIKAKGVLALCKDESGVIHAIDSNGALLRFNGSGFTEIDRLPLHRSLLINALAGTYTAFIHPNGFRLTWNGTFIMLVNNLVGDSGGTIKENLPSGIWEWSKDTGFVHRQSLSYNPLGSSTVTDYGQNRVSAVGALYEPNLYSASASGKPTLICGATYFTDASTTANAIFVDDPLDTIQKYGYFVTGWIQAEGLQDSWNKLSMKYRQFLDSGDKMTVKYRLIEKASTEISITWTSTTTFTTTTDISALVNYEAEIIQGTGSGKCAHISSVTGSGTFTVTLDETFTGVTSGTAKARIQNWTKALIISDQYSESKFTTIGKQSARIQLKACMQFTGDDEVHEVALDSDQHEPLE